MTGNILHGRWNTFQFNDLGDNGDILTYHIVLLYLEVRAHETRLKGKSMGKVDLGQDFLVIFQDRAWPVNSSRSIFHKKKNKIKKSHTVVNIVEIVIKHKYAPTAATAGLSFFHHHTHVVPNQTPVIPNVSARLATNAHGESPPVKKRPRKKNLLRDGCPW